MPGMRAVQVTSAKGPFELVEREIPIPSAGQVLIKVQACGVCHSDALTKEGAFPGITYPRVPGHEVVGLIDKVGERVPNWKPGQRVGLAGTVVIAAIVPPAAEAISLHARTGKFPASPMMVAMPIT